jgi:HEXXH motif-containing protein
MSVSLGSVGIASLATAESELSDGAPFGSYDYLSRHTSAEYGRLLALVAERFPAAETLLAALEGREGGDFLFQDPLVRRSLEDGVLTLFRGLDAIDAGTLREVLLCAAAHAEAGETSMLDATARCVPLGSAPGHTFVWADDRPATLLGRRFVEEVLKRLPGFGIEVPTDEQVHLLDEGVHLALQVTPRLARSALSHLRTVVVGDFKAGGPPINALTAPGLSGVVFLSPHALSDRAAVAETLVHESIHLKFLDIEYVQALFPVGFRPYNSPRITPAWHRHDERYGGWPLDRLLTSMQVYLSLAVFFGLAAERRGDDFYALDDCVARADRCGTRATWLFTAAQDYLDHLSPSGREFVSWMGGMLALLRAT